METKDHFFKVLKKTDEDPCGWKKIWMSSHVKDFQYMQNIQVEFRVFFRGRGGEFRQDRAVPGMWDCGERDRRAHREREWSKIRYRNAAYGWIGREQGVIAATLEERWVGIRRRQKAKVAHIQCGRLMTAIARTSSPKPSAWHNKDASKTVLTRGGYTRIPSDRVCIARLTSLLRPRG